VAGHGLFGVIIGFFFALAKFSPTRRKGWLTLSLLVPVLFHGLYDFFLMYLGENENGLITLLLFAGFVLVMVFLWRNGARFIKKLYLKDKEAIPGADHIRPPQ
jgi:RsiW-degrading membrane proteinase PrsW (M82 family)